MNTRRPRLPLALAALLAVSACGSAGGAPGGGADGRTAVVVSFYPLQYLAEQVGGAHVTVTNLTAPGKEPHDVELTPRQVGAASTAALGIYEKGLQPQVDQAFEAAAPAVLLDVSGPADLSLRFTHAVGEDEHAGESAADHAAHASAAAGGGHDHENEAGSVDPHFWLDPTRMIRVADAVAASLSEVDPEHRADYERNAAALRTRLTALDGELRSGLARCAIKDVVTSHAAFGYLTDRYGLTQVAIAGLSPEQEPEPATLARIADLARRTKVTTIYTETLASPDIARTVAAETGATTAVLDPVEGITDASAARDYPGVMRANLATLRKGQACS